MAGVKERLRRDPNALVLGGAIALATIIIGSGIAIYASASPERSGDAAAVAAADDDQGSTTTSSRASTTSTGGTATTSTSAPAGSAGATTGTDARSPGTPATPRATADPEDPPYQPEPQDPLASMTLAGCVWEPVNGGELQAWGTITSYEEDGSWFANVVWLQNDRELDEQFELFDFGPPGQTLPWRLTVPAPLQPLDLRCEVYAD
jgi:hypothetical protein